MSRDTTIETADGAQRPRAVRRTLAVLTATALATAALPVAVASAAPTAGAVLTAGKDVFPGTTSFTVDVKNNAALLGVGGEAINYIDIALPNTIGVKTTDGVVDPDGAGPWTVRRTDAGGIQTYTYRGGSLPVGGSLPLTFPGLVAAPTADRSGAFQVAVSGDDGRTTSGAGGALTTTIRTLEVVTGSLKAVAPAGVTDGSGTAGQTVDYAFSVKNYARAAQTVQPQLTSNGSDTVTQAAAASVPAGGTGTFVSKVLLGGSGDRVATFTGAATAGSSSAPGLTAPFEVQAPASLVLNAASFAPNTTRGLNAESYSVSVTKTNKPALTLSSAVLTLPTGVTTPLTQASRTISGSGSEELAFQPALVSAQDGRYGVSFRFAGTDSNGFGYSQEASLANALLIDRLAPIIRNLAVTLPADADRRTQTAASNDGDVLRIAGQLDDCAATLTQLRLVTDKGQVIEVPVSRSAGSCDFSGSVTTGGSGTTFDAATTSFTGQAAARDAAGNVGSAATSAVDVDLLRPVLDSATTMGASSSADRIKVSFFEDGDKLYGACSRLQWKVDGELVREVLYSNGQPCQAGQAGPDNQRVLVLAQPRDQDLQTNVTYTPGTRPFADPAVDRAGQDALTKTVQTIVGVVPAAPVVVSATRTGATGERETATLDEGAFFTNRPGSDLQVSFTGGRDGYLVRVYDGATRLSQAPISGSPSTVTVPIGTTDGSYTRRLALVNTAGIESPLTDVTVVLDRVKPLIAGVAGTAGSSSVTVTFTEKLAGGTNFAEDWFVFENNPDADPSDPSTARAYYQVGSVSGTGATRTLTTNRALEGIGAVGADYLQRSPSGVRYTDRAGNVLANTAS